MPLSDAPISILGVDDEEPIRNALKKFLTQQGYDVSTAASGDEALKAYLPIAMSVGSPSCVRGPLKVVFGETLPLAPAP